MIRIIVNFNDNATKNDNDNNDILSSNNYEV